MFPKYWKVSNKTGRFRFHTLEISDHEGLLYSMQAHAKTLQGSQNTKRFLRIPEGSVFIFEKFQNMKEFLGKGGFMQETRRQPKYWKVPQIPEGAAFMFENIQNMKEILIE